MAEAMNSNKEPKPDLQHNAKARKAIINEVIREVTELEEQRKKISQEINALKHTKIKGDLNMKIADFNAALRIYKLEAEDRDEFLDTLQETFEALGINGQLDFIETLPTEQDGDDEETARSKGYDAGQSGENNDTNPYKKDSANFGSWHEGWMSGQEDLARENIGTKAVN